MKDIYIADLAAFDEGKTFESFFLVLAKQQRTTSTNKLYLSLTLGDKTGTMEGRTTRASPATSNAAISSRSAAAPRASKTPSS
jgi:23S rRNA maturation-related 3'-5' exoribonuclease YhaM